MYLDFAFDIIRVGDSVIVFCNDTTIKGVVQNVSKEFISLELEDGTIVSKKDNEITNIEVLSKIEKPSTSSRNSSGQNKESRERCGMILIKNNVTETFYCSICGKIKTSKKYAIKANNPEEKICNACYGWKLYRLEKSK